ncbi:hypothetical protein CDD83_3216 [Cordyceps sp. RAO-2017]|nr:hypothetical protein CDD83_3216 [Cordyceps sp. RAO-2017]
MVRVRVRLCAALPASAAQNAAPPGCSPEAVERACKKDGCLPASACQRLQMGTSGQVPRRYPLQGAPTGWTRCKVAPRSTRGTASFVLARVRLSLPLRRSPTWSSRVETHGWLPLRCLCRPPEKPYPRNKHMPCMRFFDISARDAAAEIDATFQAISQGTEPDGAWFLICAWPPLDAPGTELGGPWDSPWDKEESHAMPQSTRALFLVRSPSIGCRIASQPCQPITAFRSPLLRLYAASRPWQLGRRHAVASTTWHFSSSRPLDFLTCASSETAIDGLVVACRTRQWPLCLARAPILFHHLSPSLLLPCESQLRSPAVGPSTKVDSRPPPPAANVRLL